MKLISVTVSCLLAAANAVKVEFGDGQCLLGSKDNPSLVVNGDCNSEFADWTVQDNGDVLDFTGSCFVVGRNGMRQVDCDKTHMQFNKYNGLYKTSKKNGLARCMVLRDGNIEWDRCNLADGIYFDTGCAINPEPKAKDIETRFIPGNAIITQLGNNQIKITKENGVNPDRKFTSILINQKCNYYTFEVVNFNVFMNFGFGTNDNGQFDAWGQDLGFRTNSIAYFTSTGGQKSIFNSLTGGERVTKLDRGVAKGEIIKVEANEEFVEFSRDGESVFKFALTEKVDLYPIVDLHYAGDEYIFTCYNE